jgi:hypothetical protein
MFVNRRAVLAGFWALSLMRPGFAATEAGMMPYRYPDPYELTPDDIAWFRSCRSLWIDAEAGAPGIFGPGLTPESMLSVSNEVYNDFERRMEQVQCAFFLHATFRPGRYALSGGAADAPAFIDVTETDITLLQHTSWRAFTIDSKRPYGDFNNYPVEMAEALGLPVLMDDKGYAKIDPKLDQELTALHRKSQFVLQAYIEHAELGSGRWLVPLNGWDAIISPRCRPVGPQAIERYKAEMAVLAERAKNEAAVELVVPMINVSVALFASP